MQESIGKPSEHALEGDAAKLKRIEAQMHRMTKIFMDGADPIVIRDLDGVILDANHETERVFGWSRDEILGKRCTHLLAPEYHHLADEVLSRLRQGESVRNIEAAVITQWGQTVPVLSTVFLLTNEHGETIGYAEIVKDITQWKEMTERLQQRNRELQHFANILAHDLGAPLRTIRGFAELIKDGCQDALSEECQQHLRFIFDSARRMDLLIEDLLKYVRIENHAVSFDDVNCDKILKQVLENLHAAISDNNAEITSDPMPTIHANGTQMIQLFQNLIDNAIKYSSAEPLREHISAKQEGDNWEFTFRDNGIGIDDKYQDKIFDVFRRLHSDEVIPGTGIGLATCKAIVERHGGRIWVESEKGKGSVFHFTIATTSPNEDSTAG